MLKDEVYGTTANPLNEKEKEYIRNHIGMVPLRKIAKALTRCTSKVCNYAQEFRAELDAQKIALSEIQKPDRISEDGFRVYDHDLVYEVVWKRYNAEYSEAVPEGRLVHQIPEKYPIWISQVRCQRRCNELNTQKPTILD